jgi:lysophospholipase L1-like esterase
MSEIKKTKFIIFAVASLMLSTIFMITLILGFDIYLHKKFDKIAVLNVWGYRGPVVKQKKPGEQRIVVLGGSTVFGYGAKPNETFPAFLESRLNGQKQIANQVPISVVNLGYPMEGAYSFKYTLQDYNYLDYDIAILYEGYNDTELMPNKRVYRHQLPIFRLTGYYFIFPTVFKEKSMVYMYGRGNLGAAYRREKIVFNPNLAERASAEVLNTAAKIAESIEYKLGQLTNKPEGELAPIETGCGERWKHYCKSLYVAIDYVLGQGKQVVVVTQPYISDLHVDQQRNMISMLRERFGNHPRLHYINLGRAINLKDRTLAYDGMHLTAHGNELIAEALKQPLIEILSN